MTKLDFLIETSNNDELFDGICSVLNHIRPEWKKEKTELNVSLFE
jgi:hypothetical protein